MDIDHVNQIEDLCEKGTVTIREPKCKECGHEIDPDKIVWG